MKNLKVETRQSKAGNDYQFISGESTYYLSALKKARQKGQTELMNIPAESAEFTKHILYNRILKGFVCKSESWNIVEQALEVLTLPDNWKEQVKNILPKAKLFDKPASSSKKPSKGQTDVIGTLVAKLEKYDTWDQIPADSIKKINEVCEANDVKIAQVRKAFVPKGENTVNDLEL